MEQLSSIDSAFVYAEDPNLPMHIATVTLYDPSTSPQGSVRLKDIINLFEQAVYNVPLFRQRLVEVPLGLDQPYWIDDPDFDIEYHVRHIALPRPGDWRQFYIQLSRINSRVLDRSRPLWEVYVIEGLDQLEGIAPGSFALMMKLHQAAMDGEALKSLFMSIHTARPEPPPAQQTFDRRLRREVRRGNLPLLINASQNSFRRFWRFPRVMQELLQGYRRIQHGQDIGDIKRHHPIPNCRFNGQLSPYRVVTSYAVPFEEVQTLRAAIDGATINDLVLTVIGGAMRLYLLDKGELPEDSLVAEAPVNLRNEQDWNAEGNRITTMNLPIHSEIEDPLERFYAVHEESLSARNYLQARGEHLVQDFADFLHPLLSRSLLKIQENLGRFPWLSHVYPTSANILVSNMAGPMEPVYLCGAKVVTGLGLGPCMPDIGLFQIASSTSGQLIFSVNACREMMPDPDFYRQCLEKSWQQTAAALDTEAQRHRTKKKPAAKSRGKSKKKSAGKKNATLRKKVSARGEKTPG